MARNATTILQAPNLMERLSYLCFWAYARSLTEPALKKVDTAVRMCERYAL